MIRSPMRMPWLLLACAVALPARADDCERSARQAAQQSLAAITAYVDADWGNRTAGAARALTRCHAAFAAHGYRLVDVSPYDENGDLQGFFVSYARVEPR